MKQYLAILGITIVFVVYAITSISNIHKKNIQIENLEQSLKTSNSKITYYQGKDSLQIAEKQVMVLTLSEMKDSYKSITQDIADMKLKLKNVKAVTITGTEIKDSVNITWTTQKINDTTKIKVGTYKDKFTTIKIQDSTCIYSVKDSLIQVVSDSRGFWRKLLFWKPIILKQDIKSFNPHSKISYLQTIQVTK